MSLQKIEAALKALAVTCNSFTLQHQANEALAIVRGMIANQGVRYTTKELKCSKHPDAPHGFNRNASHTEGRYVCDCEGWSPEITYPAEIRAAFERDCE